MKTYETLQKELVILANKIIDKQWTLDNAQVAYNSACYDYNAKVNECDRALKEEDVPEQKELARLEKLCDLKKQIYDLDKTIENYDSLTKAVGIHFEYKRNNK